MGRTGAVQAAALAAALISSCAVQAAEPQSPFQLHPGAFVSIPNDQGFIVGMCARDRSTLLDELRYRRDALTAQRKTLRAEAGDGSLSVQDIVLTVLLPGGLLYAAQRHDAMRRAQVHLTEVDTRLQDVVSALGAFAPAAPTLAASAD